MNEVISENQRMFLIHTLALIAVLIGASTPLSAQGTSALPANRLIHEKSPYLLLHAHNPVDWYPWGDEAFEKARSEQKPIFLSIGYYTCHWCHVMEHESYSNPKIAEVLNKYFVAIKVDREERPDVDRLYVAYLEATIGTAGWPLNVFLTPDRKPFQGGIYFPPDKLRTLLMKTADIWAKDRDKLTSQASRAADGLVETISKPQPGKRDLQAAILDKTYKQIAAAYDRTNGGFGAAPKFPRPVALDFLLRTYARTGQREALEMTLSTLRAMARGGIHDQLGGGFHRYATDAQWRVPHFEKMLYDQAQLAATYTDAYQITHDVFFAGVARDILDFSLREMLLSSGGFASALDADSAIAAGSQEAREGAFYVWTETEIKNVLSQQQAAIFDYTDGIDHPENNILFEKNSVADAAKHFGLTVDQTSEQLAAARKVLQATRSRRPPPPVDDKVVTAWNGMMISALAHAGQVLEEPRYLAAAESTARFLESHLYNAQSKRLLRSYRAETATIDGFLDDYADLVHALVDLYQSDFDVQWLKWAATLQATQDELFWDAQQGGYFDATSADPSLLARTHEAYDGAEPSPNSTAAMNLLRLAQITDNKSWHDEAQKTLAAFSGPLASDPESVPAMASALDFNLAHTRQILIAGDRSSADTRQLLRLVNERFLPNKVLLLADGGSEQQELAHWLPFIADAHRIEGKATIYICENYTCKLPTADPSVAARLLDSGKNAGAN